MPPGGHDIFRIMTTLSQTLAWERYWHRPHSWFERLQWAEVFAPVDVAPGTAALDSSATVPAAKRLIHVDLGAGDGGFLRARARNHPGTDFLGVERLLGRVRKIARGAFRENLGNLRALRIEVGYAVEYLFPPDSIDAITILFPDPWPKRRHHKHRLIQPAFLEACGRALRPTGWLAIKTDDPNYFEQINEALAGCAGLQPWHGAEAAALLPEVTDFERDFVREARPIYFLAARPTPLSGHSVSID